MFCANTAFNPAERCPVELLDAAPSAPWTPVASYCDPQSPPPRAPTRVEFAALTDLLEHGALAAETRAHETGREDDQTIARVTAALSTIVVAPGEWAEELDALDRALVGVEKRARLPFPADSNAKAFEEIAAAVESAVDAVNERVRVERALVAKAATGGTAAAEGREPAERDCDEGARRDAAAVWFALTSERVAPELLIPFGPDAALRVASLRAAIDAWPRKTWELPRARTERAESWFRAMLRGCGVPANVANNALKHRQRKARPAE